MYNELRYQAKTHAISEKLSKEKINKILHLLPQFFFCFLFFVFFNKKNKNMLRCKETKLNLACVARSNLSSRRKVQNYQDKKAAARHALSVIPK
jgi:hypothetical protein